MSTASSTDVLRFLHFRDKGGRTQVHEFACPHFGLPGQFRCVCPRHFAAGTVDSYVGMLQAVFNDIGRREHLNPCASADVRNWVKACAREQQRHRVPVKQANPTFSTHLRLLVVEIKLRLSALPSGEPFVPNRFLLLRDKAFFMIQWYAGDRAGDLGKASAKEVVRLEDGSLLLNHTVGKTIRSADGQLLVVPRIPDERVMCPVAAFDEYASACKAAGVDLGVGLLFPATALPRHNTIRHLSPFTSTAATKRLRVYLPDEDLSAHGARAGAAVTLLMLGASKEAVMEHCRWAHEQVFKHYTKLERIRRLDDSARVLQKGVVSVGGVSSADSAAHLYELLNSGIAQTPAF